MKTVGIIGGLGPETTSKFYLELIFLCQKLNKTHRPEILICSVPLPYDIEKDAIANNIGEERCVPFVIEAAKKLEKAGADFLVMPCNSLHVYIDDVRKHVKIPILSIVEETADFLKQKNISEVGIIATSITLNKDLYKKSLQKYGIKQIVPGHSDQSKTGQIIHNLVTNKHSKKDHKELMNIIANLENKGVEHIILACTDLQILLSQHKHVKIYDTMKIFAVATVQEILES